MAIILDGTNGVSDVDGSASTPAIRGTDTNTGIFFPAADTIAFAEGGAEAMRIDSSGNVGIGTTSPTTGLTLASGKTITVQDGGSTSAPSFAVTTGALGTSGMYVPAANTMALVAGATERARIDSSGNLLVAKTALDNAVVGGDIRSTGNAVFVRSGGGCLFVNRLASDGIVVEIGQDTTVEGNISVSGTAVSYNGGNLSRWAQLTTPKDDTPLFKGTVMSNLDEMNVYVDADGNPVENEQLNKVKVSDVEGDPNVAGVFVNWDYDEAHQVDEINMGMTGDMIIRIAQGVTVARGDLLMSAGDGTAKPQGDDIVRSKTIAKVTSTHITCTYDDGSYCVPCVLMAC
jgi:hypothetical protein